MTTMTLVRTPVATAHSLPANMTSSLLHHAMRQGPAGLDALARLHYANPLASINHSDIDPAECLTELHTVLPGIIGSLSARGTNTRALAQVLNDIRANPAGNEGVALKRIAIAFRGIAPAIYSDTVLPLFATFEDPMADLPSTTEAGFELYSSNLDTISDDAAAIASSDSALRTSRSQFNKKYERVERIGGKLAQVFLVQERATGKLFVEKVTRDGSQVERMAREAQAMESLDHPNAMKHLETYREFDTNSGEEKFRIVEEYLDPKEWEGLDSMVKRNYRFSEDDVISIMDQLDSLIRDMQPKEIVHRDIKPSNVMLRWNERGELEIKVIDFGLVGFINRDQSASSFYVGTPNYHSPEQKNNGDKSSAMDIFSEGLLLLELMRGVEREGDYEAQPTADDITRLKRSRSGRFSSALIDRVAQKVSLNQEERFASLDLPSLRSFEIEGEPRVEAAGAIAHVRTELVQQPNQALEPHLASAAALVLFCNDHPMDAKKNSIDNWKKTGKFGATAITSATILMAAIGYDAPIIGMLSLLLFLYSSVISAYGFLLATTGRSNKRKRTVEAYKIGRGFTVNTNWAEESEGEKIHPIDDLDPTSTVQNRTVFINGLEIEHMFTHYNNGTRNTILKVKINNRSYSLTIKGSEKFTNLNFNVGDKIHLVGHFNEDARFEMYMGGKAYHR